MKIWICPHGATSYIKKFYCYNCKCMAQEKIFYDQSEVDELVNRTKQFAISEMKGGMDELTGYSIKYIEQLKKELLNHVCEKNTIEYPDACLKCRYCKMIVEFFDKYGLVKDDVDSREMAVQTSPSLGNQNIASAKDVDTSEGLNPSKPSIINQLGGVALMGGNDMDKKFIKYIDTYGNIMYKENSFDMNHNSLVEVNLNIFELSKIIDAFIQMAFQELNTRRRRSC